MTSAAHAWQALSVALTASVPACAGDARFTDDGRAESTNRDLGGICSGCPVLAECRAYALSAPRHAIVGYWAGRRRGTRQAEAAA